MMAMLFRRSPAIRRRFMRIESQLNLIPYRFCRTPRSTRTRSQTAQLNVPAALKSSSLPKQAQVSRVKFQAQYQAFVRLRSAAAQLFEAIALNSTCVQEPFTRGGFSL
jgi:hypothetical protein